MILRIGYGVACLLVVVSAAIGVSHGAPSDCGSAELTPRLEGAVARYNDDPGLPDAAAEYLLRGERVNVFVSATDGTELTYSFRLDDDLRIVEFTCGTRDDGTIHLQTTHATARDIANSDRMLVAFVTAIDERTVAVECVGFLARLKCIPVTGVIPPVVFVVGTGAGVISAFALLHLVRPDVLPRLYAWLRELPGVVYGWLEAIKRILVEIKDWMGLWPVLVWLLKRLRLYDPLYDLWKRLDARLDRQQGGDRR